MIIEEQGLTEDGLPYMVIVMENLGTRNGYVGVLSDSILYGEEYSKDDEYESSLSYNISVYGGLTYSGYLGRHIVGADNPYFFGFDCNHLEDGYISINEMKGIVSNPKNNFSYNEQQQIITRYNSYLSIVLDRNNIPKSLDYVRNECFRLSTQLKEMEKKYGNV